MDLISLRSFLNRTERKQRKGETEEKINLQNSGSGLGGRAEERADREEEDGGDDDDGNDGVSGDALPGLIQNARVFPSPFHSHTQQCQTLWLTANCSL